MSIMDQINLFEIINERFSFDKNHKIRLFEAFSGIGCQRMALDRLKINYVSVGISEIDKYALKSYQAMHGEFINYGDIKNINSLPEIDVFTWSFPCTDLSKAGKQKGLNQTRSGLVYEVLRILHEVHKSNNLPKVLIMENVVDLIQVKFIREFQKIQIELESLGYSNYTETLNSKDFGVAQNRDRVFMVSILGNHYYEFPKKIKIEKRLLDYLENEIDDKYYLSNDLIERIGKWNSQQNPIVNAKTEDDKYVQCITAKGNTTDNASMLLIKEKTKKGYTEAYVGDGVYINRPHQKRGVVQEGMIQTLKTNSNDLGVVIYDDFNSTIRGDQNTIGTLITNCGNDAIRNGFKLIENNLRIRKLTPLECWRLMGIDDSYFEQASKVCSSAQLYKQAGNGIVVDVFAHILRNLFKEM